MAADLINVFFNTDEFAVAAVYTPAFVAPALAAPVTIKVLFNKEYESMIGVGGFRYWIETPTAAVIAAKPRETIVIDGVTYKIKGPPHHTGDGISQIELSID